MRLWRRVRWAIWHPHQKLWNWDLVEHLDRVPGGSAAGHVVISGDSALLALRVIARRGRLLGIPALLKRPRCPQRALYVDCGTHQEGLELRAVSQWFGDSVRLVGYEASSEHFAAAERNLRDVPRTELRHAALVGPDYPDSTVRLYKAGGDGRADSLFAERGSDFEEVPAVRLSQELADYYTAEGPVPTVVRMNIEGAELFVVEDLVAAGVADAVCGYYGMWDDLSKIDPDRDRQFRRLLRANRIRTVPFNDRDLGHRLREWAIRYDLATSLASCSQRSVLNLPVDPALAAGSLDN
jgi:hypothetical protein